MEGRADVRVLDDQWTVVTQDGLPSVHVEHTLAITPSGVNYDDLTPEGVCVIDLDGTLVEGDMEPSSEVPMHTAVYRGKEYAVTLLPKVEIEVVVPNDVVEEVIQAIIAAARTGEIGDGRVFVLPVDVGYNIRTGEQDIV